jgi:hypothetical protein
MSVATHDLPLWNGVKKNYYKLVKIVISKQA